MVAWQYDLCGIELCDELASSCTGEVQKLNPALFSVNTALLTSRLCCVLLGPCFFSNTKVMIFHFSFQLIDISNNIVTIHGFVNVRKVKHATALPSCCITCTGRFCDSDMLRPQWSNLIVCILNVQKSKYGINLLSLTLDRIKIVVYIHKLLF